MASKTAELSLEVEQGGPGIEEGDTCVGTIQGTEVNTFEYDGDNVSYYQITIEEDTVGLEFNPSYPARITPGTGLGRLVQRFGASLTVGDSVDLHEIFTPGTKVQFEVEEEENEDGDAFLNVVKESLRPEGAESEESIDVESNGHSSQDDDEDDIRPEVLELVDEEEGSKEADIKRMLAKKGGEYVKAYKSLSADGDIQVEEGLVFLG